IQKIDADAGALLADQKLLQLKTETVVTQNVVLNEDVFARAFDRLEDRFKSILAVHQRLDGARLRCVKRPELGKDLLKLGKTIAKMRGFSRRRLPPLRKTVENCMLDAGEVVMAFDVTAQAAMAEKKVERHAEDRKSTRLN